MAYDRNPRLLVRRSKEGCPARPPEVKCDHFIVLQSGLRRMVDGINTIKWCMVAEHCSVKYTVRYRW